MNSIARSVFLKLFWWLSGAIVYPLLVLPIIVVVLVSFGDGNVMKFPPNSFSLKWYTAIFHNEVFMKSLYFSLRIAGVATVVGTILGIVAAFAIKRSQKGWSQRLSLFVLAPLMVPVVALGLALLQTVGQLSSIRGFWLIALSHILLIIPYVVKTFSVSLEMFDDRLEMAAMSLRANPLRVLRSVTLPLLAPGVIASAIFAFVVSFGNVTLTLFLAFGGRATLPVQIFTYIEQELTPIIASVSVLVIAITSLVIFALAKTTKLERLF